MDIFIEHKLRENEPFSALKKRAFPKAMPESEKRTDEEQKRANEQQQLLEEEQQQNEMVLRRLAEIEKQLKGKL